MNEGQANAGIKQISFLGEPAGPAVSFEQTDGDVVVTLPKAPLDQLMSVLKVELSVAPVVNNAIRPLTRALRPQTGNSKVKPGDYFLSAAFAKIHGEKLHFSLGTGAGAQRENLKGWTEESDFADWEIRVDQPGSHELKVNYSSWMHSGKFVVEVGGRSFEHEVAAAKAQGKKSPLKASFRTVSLGEVQFDKAGTYKVAIKATEIDAKAKLYGHGLMMLREVILAKP